MDELRSQARMHLPARQRFALSELNQTFRVRAAQPDNPADTLGISKTMISHLGNGTKGLNLARADATDKALQAQGIGGVPLTAIFWQQRHEQAQQEWDQAKSFGEQLTALRQALNLSQPALAQLAGVSNVTIHKWEGGHTSPLRFAKSEHFDNGRLDTLIHALEERQEQLKQDWPDSFIPPLNEMRQAQLRRSAHQIPLHQPAEHKSGYYYTDEQLSEMVVLQQHGVVQNEAAHLCGLHSPDHAIRRAHQLWGERFEKLDTPEREAATQRLAMRGIGPDGTLQTQLGSILPAERFQDKDNGKSR
jgi:transcriptional regulator with XRE-family HTH domain